MKKLLALVLALVMTLSLCTVSNAAYSDAKDIDYKEAVDVMSALGILEGSDGKFNPDGILTREQAAKIITYMVLGQKAADKLSVGEAPFADVAADRWSAPFVAYCKAAGIIAGVGDNKFDPTAELTGLAFAKMVLCATGYDQSVEKMVGENWAINTAKLVIKTELDGNVAVSSAKITRQEAAQLALDAMKLKLRTYEEGLNIVGTNLSVTGGGKYTESTKTMLKDTYGVIVNKDNKDAFGRPATTYYRNKDTAKDWAKVDLTFAKKPVATYTSSLKEKDLYTDLSKAGGINFTGSSAKFFVINNVYVDGVQKVVPAEADVNTVAEYNAGTAAYPLVKTWTDGAKTYLANSASDTMDQKGKGFGESVVIAQNDKTSVKGAYDGATVEFYKTANGVYTMVVVDNFYGKVTKVNKAVEATDTKRSVTVAGLNFETEDFAKEDAVIYTKANGVIKSMVAADNTVDGKVTDVASTYVVVNGTKYALGVKGNAVEFDYGTTYTFTLDENNAIVNTAAKENAVSTDYLYVIEYQTKVTSDLGAASRTAKADVIFTDGTNKVIDLEITDAGEDGAHDYEITQPVNGGTVNKNHDLTDGEGGAINSWFAYVENTDGTYTLSALDSKYATQVAANTNVTMTKDTMTTLGTHYTNSATTVVSIDTKFVTTTKTGLVKATLTGVASKNNILYTYAKDSKVVTAVYAVNQNAAADNVTYAYAIEAGAVTKYGTKWTFAVDGEQVTYVVKKGSTTPTANNIYSLTSSTNDTYTVSQITGGNLITAKVEVLDAKQIKVEGTDAAQTLADNYVVFDVDTDTADVVGEASTFAEKDTVTLVKNSDGKVAVIYVVDHDEG